MVWIAAGFAFCSTAAVYAVEFTRSSINLPASTSAFETAFDLDGDGRKDILAVFQRRIMIFFQSGEGSFPTAPDIEIGAGESVPEIYAAVSIGKVSADAGQQLLLIGPNGVDYVSIAQMRGRSAEPVEPQPLISKPLTISSGPSLRYLNAALDMTGSGQTSIVLPDDSNLSVYSAAENGQYIRESNIQLPLRTTQNTSLESEPVLLGSPLFNGQSNGLVRSMPKSGVWHSVQFAVNTFCEPLLVTDFNLDRRMDVISPSRLMLQNPSGGFESLQSAIYSRISSAIVPHENQNTLVTAPNLADFNGDKILDTFSVEATAAKLSPRTDISVYLGRQDRNFSEKADVVLRTRDFAYSDAIPIGDVNGDGALDVAMIHLDFQPSSMQSQLKSYLRNGLEGDLRFYLWDKARNRFPESHNFKHPVLVNYEIYGARQFFRQQVVISQDFTGDDFPDLLIKTGAQQFSVFENVDGKGFSSKPLSVVSTAPTRFSALGASDLNSDGVCDVVISGYVDGQDDRIIYSLFVSKK